MLSIIQIKWQSDLRGNTRLGLTIVDTGDPCTNKEDKDIVAQAVYCLYCSRILPISKQQNFINIFKNLN